VSDPQTNLLDSVVAKSNRDDKKNVSLHVGSSFGDAWDHVLLPWFQTVGTAAFGNEQSTAVITPSSVTSSFLRAKLLEHNSSLLQVVRGFTQLVRQCGFELIADADRAALEAVSKNTSRFSNLLIVGFNGAHWPLWPLLQASVAASSATTVTLEYPRNEARAID